MKRTLLLLALLLCARHADSQEPPRAGQTRAMARALEDLGDHFRTVAKEKVTLLWLIDKSPSMSDDLKHIQSKLDEVFDKARNGKDFSTAVVGFDDAPEAVLPLTSKLDAVRKAIAAVGTAGSGTENCMKAVEIASRSFPEADTYRAIVLVTDERGNDEALVEAALETAKERQVHVFVFGREAPFGWALDYERDDKLGFNVPTDSGPESAGPELLQMSPLCCWQGGYPNCRKMFLDGDHRKQAAQNFFQSINPMRCDLGFDAEVLSGFGCWGQSRLAKETGGKYYIVRDSETFKPQDLADYAPELGPRKEWESRNLKDPLRRPIVGIIAEMGKGQEFGLEVEELTEGGAKPLVEKALGLEKRVSEWLARLEKNVPVETGQAKPPGKRWAANRHLQIGQLLALLHWLEQYRLTLEEGPWADFSMRLWPSFKIRGKGERRHKAIEQLDAVARNHPGTPWAATAKLMKDRLKSFVLRPILPSGPSPGAGAGAGGGGPTGGIR